MMADARPAASRSPASSWVGRADGDLAGFPSSSRRPLPDRVGNLLAGRTGIFCPAEVTFTLQPLVLIPNFCGKMGVRPHGRGPALGRGGQGAANRPASFPR